MSDLFKIHWYSTENGKFGVGPKTFLREEADKLCAELNEEHPDIEHSVIPADSHLVVRVKKPAETDAPTVDALTDSDLMPFGEHRGKPMVSVPSSYLDYILGQPWLRNGWPAVYAYIIRSRNAIDQDLERNER